MKILIAINDLNIRGGTHKQVLRLCQYLSKNHEIIIYTRTYDKEKTYPEFQQFEIVCSNVSMIYKNENCIDKLKNRITRYKNNRYEDKFLNNLLKDVDIVNLHDSDIARLAKMAKRKNKKVVLQINDLPSFFLQGVNKELKDCFRFKMNRARYNKLMKYVDEITVNVSKNAEAIKECMNRDAHVFYCGVDVNKNLDKHTKMHDNHKINLFSSGVFFPYRNYETLVKVVDKLVKNNMDVHLDIMGSTSRDAVYANSIKKMVTDMDLENYITIWGQVDEDKYVELHNNADIFLFININQSWGLAVFEAMSCGLPVIVSESVGAIELLKDKENAIIVDPENVDEVCDEIMNLKKDEKYYNEISNHAYEIVKEFTWDNLYSSKMLELFEKMVKE